MLTVQFAQPGALIGAMKHNPHDTPKGNEMTSFLNIEGAEREVRCDCCNRSLKVGIRTSALGTIGADCFRSFIVSDYKRFSQGKPCAKFLRELAIIQETKTPEFKRLRGYVETMFRYEMAT